MADKLRDEVREIGGKSGYRVSITALSPQDVIGHFDERSAFWLDLAGAILLKGESPIKLARLLKAQK